MYRKHLFRHSLTLYRSENKSRHKYLLPCHYFWDIFNKTIKQYFGIVISAQEIILNINSIQLMNCQLIIDDTR